MTRREPNYPMEAVLRVHGSDRPEHGVPADLLARTLVGLQQTVFLLAAAGTRQTVRERFRPTEDLRRRAALLCEVPALGSFALPMRLADPGLQMDSGARRGCGLLVALHEMLDVVSAGGDALPDLVPDSGLRLRVMREIQRFIPEPGEPWTIGFSSFERPETLLDERASANLRYCITRETAPEDTVMTVTGALMRVFFEEKKVTIRYKPTNKLIDCFLREDVVDEVLENRRRLKAASAGSFLIQVTGQFVLDASGHPKRLINVYNITPVDMSAMTFERVRYSQRLFEIAPPLRLDVALDESGQLFVANDDSLGIHAYAQTREQLAEEIGEQIAHGWDEYAQCDPAHLTDGASRLRDEVLRRMREIHAEA